MIIQRIRNKSIISFKKFLRDTIVIFTPFILVAIAILWTFGDTSISELIPIKENENFLQYRYIAIPTLIILLYPLLTTFSPTFATNKIWKLLWSYNAAFFFVFSLLVTLHYYLALSWYGLLAWVVFVLLAIFVTKQYYQIAIIQYQWSYILWFVLFVIVYLASVYLPQQLPNYLDKYYTNQILKAERIIKTDWENATSFEKAKATRFLETAYLHYFNKHKRTDSMYFKRIFDTTPEQYFGDKLKDIRSTTTRATNASQVGENAQVELWVVTVDNRIVTTGTDIPIMMTVYDIYFQNTTTENQEVIINFEAPNSLSVVSDLKLWLNLELQGQVASRGAARKVYEDSLRINKDPALIEKIGISTYNLRVFPILSKLDTKTNGRQRVQITLLTPVNNTDTLTYSPKFSIINARVDTNSSLVSKVFIDKQLVQEDIIKANTMELYLQSPHILSDDIVAKLPSISIYDTCIPRNIIDHSISNTQESFEYQNWLDYIELQSVIDKISTLMSGHNQPLNTDKVYLFMDNSTSVTKNTADTLYPEIYTQIKNYNNTLQDVELYSYNFRVDPLASIDTISYRWYSDIDSVIGFIEQNNIENSRIILVTDDDSYNASTKEITNRNFKKLLSNQINVIKIGDDIKRYKSDFMSLLWASQWNIYHVDSIDSVTTTLDTIFDESRTIIDLCGTDEWSWNERKQPLLSNPLLSKIYAGYLASGMMRSVSDDTDRTNIAELQGKLATQFTIVTQFNSMIALENEQQQRDLARYEQQADRYASDFNNTVAESQWTNRNQWFGRQQDNMLRGDTLQNDTVVESQWTNRNEWSIRSEAMHKKINLDIAWAWYSWQPESRFSLFSWSQINIFGSLIILWAYLIVLYHWYLFIHSIILSNKTVLSSSEEWEPLSDTPDSTQ
jgi:hypothetical protein